MWTVFSLGWWSTLHSDKSYQLTLPSWRSVKGSCRTQDTTKGVVLRPLCACVIGLGSNVSLSCWPSQLRLRDERHRYFFLLLYKTQRNVEMVLGFQHCQKKYGLSFWTFYLLSSTLVFPYPLVRVTTVTNSYSLRVQPTPFSFSSSPFYGRLSKDMSKTAQTNIS